jgi:hypothetical protein
MTPDNVELIGTPGELAAVERLAADLYLSRLHVYLLRELQEHQHPQGNHP